MGHSDVTAYSSGSVSSRFSTLQASGAAAASKSAVGRGRSSGRISSKGLTGTLTGEGFSSSNDDDDDDGEDIGVVFDAMEMGRSKVAGEGNPKGDVGKKSGRKAGGSSSRQGRMMSRTFSGRANRTAAKEAPQSTEAEGDLQESDSSRTLRPAVLRAGRPIPRNPSNAGIERSSVR